MALEEELSALDHKLLQLKLDYERYFLGTRPREPIQLRAEIQKLIAVHSNQPIQNTALRFKFSGICSRFQAYKRQWADILRRMEEGTYSRHRFKAILHERERGAAAPAAGGEALFDSYVEARRRCGQEVKSLSPEKLEAILAQQREALRQRYGDAEFRFKVVVEDGKAKLKASRVR